MKGAVREDRKAGFMPVVLVLKAAPDRYFIIRYDRPNRLREENRRLDAYHHHVPGGEKPDQLRESSLTILVLLIGNDLIIA